MKIIKRNGSEVDFDLSKITAAITKANDADGTKKEPTYLVLWVRLISLVT
jgi:hypothetical protein